MLRQVISIVLSCLALGASVLAADGAVIKFQVSQYDPSTNKDILLLADSATVVKGVSAVGFMGALSLDLEVTAVDSQRLAYNAHVITLSAQPQTVARQFQAEFGLPARISDLRGKNDSRYTLTITPLRRVDVDTTSCGSRKIGGQDFSVQPSAHLDIFTVPRSFGEFYQPLVKGLMEDTYDRFNSILHFTLPGKYSVYLCPCAMYSVLWESRFGAVIDPTRNAIYVLYTKDFNSADPFVIANAAILRHFGYAPPALSEGLSNYLSFGVFDAQKMHSEKKLLPLDSMLNSHSYYASDPQVADRSSASFVKYLLDQYKIDKFLELYRKADDLNVREALASTYGKPSSELEKEWWKYLDTLTFRPGQASYFADRAEAMFDYEAMLRYNKEYLDLSRSAADSLYALEQLVRSCFLTGNYYDAEASQAQLTGRDSSAGDFVTLAGYQMMAGQYAEALTSLNRAKAKDSANPVMKFNLALHALYSGNHESARDQLFALVAANTGAGVESRAMLGHLMKQSPSPADIKTADGHLSEAIAMVGRRQRPGQPANTTDLMWTGIAYLGLGDVTSASSFLQSAQFYETRPFYLGMISLWLGKCADVRGQRKAARDYYGQVLAQSSADYHQREARQYLEQPYTQ